MNRLSLSLIITLSCAAPQQVLAAPLNSFLTNGYVVQRATGLSSPFRGCEVHQRLTFTDGTIFDCSRSSPRRLSLTPRVLLLAKPGENISAVFIDGEALEGTISSIGGLKRKLSIESVLPNDNRAQRNSSAIQPIQRIGPIDSISALQREQSSQSSSPSD